MKKGFQWGDVPLLRIIVPLTLGITAAIWTVHEDSAQQGAALLGVLALVLGLAMRAHWKAIGFSVLLLVFGYALTWLRTDRLFPKHFSLQLEAGQSGVLRMTLASRRRETPKKYRFQARVHAAYAEGLWTSLEGDLLIYLPKTVEAEALDVGDEILFLGEIIPIASPVHPDDFDFQAYMANRQVHHQAFPRDHEWKQLRPTSLALLPRIRRWQAWLKHLIETWQLSSEGKAVLKALLIGVKDDLSDDQRQSFARAGAMHVLAVSGLHVGIIYLIIGRVFLPLKRFRNGQVWITVLSLLLLWAFACMTGLSPSVARATTMFSFIAVGSLLGRSGHVINAVLASAFVLLLVNPYLLVDVGFQLSYAAVIGIVLLQPRIEACWKPKAWIVKKGWALASVSIAAQLATGPIAAYYFNQFPTYFLLTNFWVIPLASVILPLGVACVVVSPLPTLAAISQYGLNFMLWLMNTGTAWIANLPWATVDGINLDGVDVTLSYAGIACIILFLLHKHIAWLQASLLVSIAWQVAEIAVSLDLLS